MSDIDLIIAQRDEQWVRVHDLLKRVLRNGNVPSTLRRYTNSATGLFWRFLASSRPGTAAEMCAPRRGGKAAWSVSFFVARYAIRHLMRRHSEDFKQWSDILELFLSIKSVFKNDGAAAAANGAAQSGGGGGGGGGGAESAATGGDAPRAPPAAPIDQPIVGVKRHFVPHDQFDVVVKPLPGKTAAKRKRAPAPTAAAAAADARVNEKRARAIAQANREQLGIVRKIEQDEFADMPLPRMSGAQFNAGEAALDEFRREFNAGAAALMALRR